MKNKKYEGSIDAESKMPFMSEKIDDAKNVLANARDEKEKGRILELEDRTIEIHDK